MKTAFFSLKVFIFLSAVFILSLFIPLHFSIINAQGVDSQNWMCLDLVKVEGHTATLQSKKQSPFMPPGIDVYVVECLGTDAGEICTTGEDATDKTIFGLTNTNLRRLEANYGYKRNSFTGTEPMPSDSEGKIGPLDWTSEIYPSVDHKFFGVTFMEPPALDTMTAGSMKVGSFYFQNANGKCASQRWDPYGTAFDIKSLEPIGGVSVKLMVKKGAVYEQFSLPGVINPQKTPSDGSFSFVVPDGTYKLEPNVASHRFPIGMGSQPHSNYIKAYFDLYNGEPIVQAGVMQHRDIPMEPLGDPYTAPIKIMGYSIALDKLNKVYNITGVLSHPLSIAQLYSGTSKIAQVTADNDGGFAINISSEGIDTAQNLTLKAVKVDLTRLRAGLFQNIFGNVYAQSQQDTVTLTPIPNYLEGYAYTDNEQTVANATINIFLINSERAFYSTKADSTGYFKIPSQYLPSLPYSINIVSPEGQSVTLTTSKFSQLNRTVAKENNIKYDAYAPDPGTTTSGNPPSATPRPASDYQIPEEFTQNQPNGPNIKVKDESINVEILALLLTVAIVSAIGIYYYFKKRKSDGFKLI